MLMVDLGGYFWNQVYEQLRIWHNRFSTSVISNQLMTTSGA